MEIDCSERYLNLVQVSSFKFLHFHILIKHKEQELGRKECGGVKTKTRGVKKCLHTWGELHTSGVTANTRPSSQSYSVF